MEFDDIIKRYKAIYTVESVKKVNDLTNKLITIVGMITDEKSLQYLLMETYLDKINEITKLHKIDDPFEMRDAFERAIATNQGDVPLLRSYLLRLEESATICDFIIELDDKLKLL